MKVKINHPRANWSRSAAADIIAKATRSLKDFFHGCLPALEEIVLHAYKVGPGGEPERLVFILPASPDPSRTEGVPVGVYTQGTQKMVAIMRVPGMTDAALRELIEKGPYLRKTCSSEKESVPTTSASASANGHAPSPAVPTSHAELLEVIRKKLEERRVAGEELARAEEAAEASKAEVTRCQTALTEAQAVHERARATVAAAKARQDRAVLSADERATIQTIQDRLDTERRQLSEAVREFGIGV